jgi:hypothetical protein
VFGPVANVEYGPYPDWLALSDLIEFLDLAFRLLRLQLEPGVTGLFQYRLKDSFCVEKRG